MAVKDMKNDELVDHYYELKHLSADDEETANYYKDIIREMASRFAIMTENEAISVKSSGENMLNETAIRIIEEIPIETDEQKAALELATEALKRYKCLELAPIDDKSFSVFSQDQVLHIYCKTKEDMDNAIAIINKEFSERNDKKRSEELYRHDRNVTEIGIQHSWSYGCDRCG